jgi:hypothetical protein
MHKVDVVEDENGVPMVCYKDFPTIMEVRIVFVQSAFTTEPSIGLTDKKPGFQDEPSLTVRGFVCA